MSCSGFRNFFKNSCVDHCCFCIKPRTGCLIIGYLHLVCIVSVTISIILAFFTLEISPTATQGDANIANFITIFTFYIPMFVCVLYLVFTIVLIVGLYQNKPNLVDMFIIFMYMIYVLLLVVFILCFVLDLQMILIAISDMIYFAVSFYCVLVLRSYHAKMNEDTGTAIYSTESAASDLQHGV